MRRWLAIFFMVFMPLQLSWAAVSAYCEHESGAAANHVGHHEHRHKGDEPDAGSKAVTHLDCGFCHIAGVVALPSGGPSSPAVAMALAMAPPPLGRLVSRYPAEPERPKWALPA